MEGVLVGPGTVLAGRYTLEREVGRGGTATVYLALDQRHRRPVAVKILRSEVAASLGPQRFLREIEIAARLTHPHILPLHDSGESGDLLYYVMPFVEGESLRERLRREGRLRPVEACRIAHEVADALAYAHAHGVVHRDIKPGNILLESGHAVVADFGIARALSEAGGEELTTSGLAIGTPMYMSPEQISGARVDGRSDVYSLGCVLYEMITGEPPFGGPDASAIVARQLYEQPPSLSLTGSPVPADVAVVIQTALAKAPAERFPDAARFAEALATSGTRTAARRPTRARRAGTIGFTAAVLLLSLLLLGRRIIAGRAAAADRPNWILMSAFDGPPGDPGLGEAVRELVGAELDQSRYVATMPRQQVSAAMRDAGLPDTTRLTPSLARELAVRNSVRVILSGSVRVLAGRHYAVVLRVTDADSDKAVLSVAGQASDQDLIPRVQELARQIRRGLGERRSAIEANKPLVQVATPSFEAYRKYVGAVDLAERADFTGSNRLVGEALALDSSFAAAWALMSSNYSNARLLDSSRLALAEALRHPDRLRDLLRYRLEADAAYAIRYDIGDAVRWYDLYLKQDPQSSIGHNERGTYLFSLGRYGEAVSEFQRALELAPFGRRQISLFNQVAALLALGRAEQARDVSRELTGSLEQYASLLYLNATGEWRMAESAASALAASPSTSSWVKAAAITTEAGAAASRGAVAASDRILRQAILGQEEPGPRWYVQARLLLASASGQPLGPADQAILADTSGGGLIAGGMWAAMNGDSATANRRLIQLRDRDPVELRRLGGGAPLLQATIDARASRWQEVTTALSPAATKGENDGADPDQVSSLAMRWLVADAYERLGKLDSATAFFELVQASALPFGHMALRGLVYPFAERRLALLYARLRRPEIAAGHWRAFEAAFVTPDPALKSLLVPGSKVPAPAGR